VLTLLPVFVKKILIFLTQKKSAFQDRRDKRRAVSGGKISVPLPDAHRLLL